VIDGFCFGVDTPEALAQAQRFFAGDRSRE